MENYLYVSRADNWIDRHNCRQISEHEWQNYLKNDPELESVPNSPNTATFFGESICWEKGEIYYVDPDELAFYKMLQIANTIDACVRGGDGRTYFTISAFFYPQGISKPETRPPLLKFEKDRLNKKRVWWKRLLNIGAFK